MRKLPPAAQLYIWGLSLLAGVAFVRALTGLEFQPDTLIPLVVFGAASIIAGFFPVVLSRGMVEISASMAINIAVSLLFPFSLAILIPSLSALVAELHQRRIWYKAMFNVSHVTVTYMLLHLFFRELSGAGYGLPALLNPFPLLIIGIAYFLIDSSLVLLVVSLAARTSFFYIWQTHLRSITWHQISMICTGFLLAILWSVEPWSIVLVLLPVAILRQASALTAMLKTQTYEAVEVLVDTVDARDASTHQHSERVAQYTRRIAEEMKLSQREVDDIALAARLHDLGKVGIRDTWLYKRGPLTEEEREQFELHAPLGADIVARFPALGVVHLMIRHHHERWDGGGYPDQLQGEEIPLGARIIGVADAFDAMTSDRPYRVALSVEEARRRLVAGSGTQFDPEVVAPALRVLWGHDDGVLRDAPPAPPEPAAPPPVLSYRTPKAS